MSTPHIIQTAFEIVLCTFALWALFHETVIAEWEKQILKKIKPHFEAVKNWIIGE